MQTWSNFVCWLTKDLSKFRTSCLQEKAYSKLITLATRQHENRMPNYSVHINKELRSLQKCTTDRNFLTKIT